MQARTQWTPPGGVLGRLCDQARDRASSLRSQLRDLRRLALQAGPVASLQGALSGDSRVGIIAEIKRRSPTSGTIAPAIEAAPLARAYVAGGAAAVSVLTEPESFGGSNDDLLAVRDVVSAPLLKKDFHVDAAQIWEARALGASALLFIVRAVGPDDLVRLADAAGEAGIEALFEVRDEWELEWALETGATVIGVNRRNLETLVMEPDVLGRLLPRIPPYCVAISESGIEDRTSVEDVAQWGADAVLVGSSLSASVDPSAAVLSMCGVPRRGRRG